VEHLKKIREWRVFVAPDHYTPIVKKTHVADPVPFIFSGTDLDPSFCCSGSPYTEANAKETGIALERGYELMLRLVKGWKHYG
jgi:2,3-bisphosphoglycerate-independent phosphoglycerate mutase